MNLENNIDKMINSDILWQIVKDNFFKYFGKSKSDYKCSGLCSLIHILTMKKIISTDERTRLFYDLTEYAKFHKKKINEYFWEPEKEKPRLNFIEIQISKHKNKV